MNKKEQQMANLHNERRAIVKQGGPNMPKKLEKLHEKHRQILGEGVSNGAQSPTPKQKGAI